MTLHILWQMIKRYWWLVIGLPVVCAVFCAAFLMSQPEQETDSSAAVELIVNSQFQTVIGMASSEAALAKEADPDVAVDIKPDLDRMTVKIAVSELGQERNSELALQIAENAAQKTSALFIDVDPEVKIIPFYAEVTDPVITQEELKSKKLFLAVALLAGFFIAILVLTIIYMKRRPVTDAESLQEALDLPVLECLPTADGGNRLLANIRFAANDNQVKSVCLIPLADSDAADAVGVEISAALQAEQRTEAMEIECCPSLMQSMDAAYRAQKAEAAVLCVRMWKDGMRAALSAKAELQLAKAPLIGVVLLKAKGINKQ